MAATPAAPLKGILVSFLRSSLGDCSAGGVSSRFKSAVLVWDGMPAECQTFEARVDLPALKLVRRSLGRGEYLHAEPVDRPQGLVGPMFGGAFVHTSDARFSEQVCRYPIPVHDRFETQAAYDANFF